jgi:hypothetical protein
MDIKYFGHYDLDSGNYLGFYPTDIWDEDKIPTPNIELTRDEWQLATAGRCKVVNNVHVHFPITEDELIEKQLNIIRSERDRLLKDSDWTQIPNSPLSAEKVQEWATYRQQLRDITNTTPYEFPTSPQK